MVCKAVKSIVVDVPRDFFFKVITDYEKMPTFIAELSRVLVERKEGNVVQVSYTVSLLKRINYTLRLEHYPPERVAWTLIKGDFMKKNEGQWVLEELDKKKTKAIYEICIEGSFLVPSSLLNQLQQANLPKMLRAFKQRAEELYRKNAE